VYSRAQVDRNEENKPGIQKIAKPEEKRTEELIQETGGVNAKRKIFQVTWFFGMNRNTYENGKGTSIAERGKK